MREKGRNKGVSAGSLPRRRKWLEMGRSEVRSFLWLSHFSAGTQGLGASSVAFPGELTGRFGARYDTPALQ